MTEDSRYPQLEGDIVHSLWLLTGRDVEKLLDSDQPSPELREFLRQASLPQLNGLLIETLRYWHLRSGGE